MGMCHTHNEGALMPGENIAQPDAASQQAAETFDAKVGPDLRYEVKAADLVRQLVEPESGGLWRRRAAATNSPTFGVKDSYITGVLDLRGAELDFLLRFENCRFEQQPDVRESKLLGLAFLGCWLPGLKARNLECKNDVRLLRSHVDLTPATSGEPQTSLALGSRKEPGMPDAAVVLTDAVVEGSVVLSKSSIDYREGRAIQADRLAVSGALLAYRLHTNGEVRLPGLRTGGNVNLSGARLHNPHGLALNAMGAHIGGSMLCETENVKRGVGDTQQRFSTRGMVSVQSAHIDGDLVMRGARLIVNPGGDVAIEEWRDAMHTGDPSIDPWPSLVADRMRLDGNLICGDGFRSDGTVRMINAVIGGSLRLANAEISVRRREQQVPQYDRALHIDGTEISGDIQATRLVTEGQLRLADISVGGNLLARYATFSHAGRDVFSARRSHVSGNVQLADTGIDGTVQLQGIQVGGSIEMFGAELTSPTLRTTRSYSVDLRAASVGRDLVCTAHGAKPFTAEGGITLDGAKVGRRISFAGAVLHSVQESRRSSTAGIDGRGLVRGVALDASDVVADEFVLTPHQPPVGSVVLRRAHCATLDDNVALWRASGGLELEEFRYDALHTPIDLERDDQVHERIALLRDAMRRYRPGPYDQLATMLRACGNEEHASLVLMRKQQYRYDALRKGAGLMGPGVWLWSWLQRAVVGYGYRPIRALGWLALLLVAGSLWFGLLPDPCVNDPRYTVSGPRCVVKADDTGLEWNPVLYTVDLLVPIVDFGNKGRWHTGGVDKWVATGFTATGWILATTVAAGLTRTLRRQ